MLNKGCHLTYCTNIHPGESWAGIFQNLKTYIPSIHREVAKDRDFGIGLRLSNEASLEILEKGKLEEFKSWLSENRCYVFTLNGFPYGGFHQQVVKDEVHQPDWTTKERKTYTARLFDILAELLPDGMDGGISTSPLSYRHWHNNQTQLEEAIRQSTLHIAGIAEKLYHIHADSGKLLHLDIEPEPDGILENSEEVVDFYKNWLLPLGGKYLMQNLGCDKEEAEEYLKRHVRICYDVCHFAVVYEKPKEVLETFEKEGIQIGKIQISAALKIQLPQVIQKRKQVEKVLLPFVESTYLHQVVGKDQNGNLTSYSDLPDALITLAESKMEEWRIHFHVPVFLADYGEVSSTQEDILEVLAYIRQHPVTNHLEVETYTWDVLPKAIGLDLGSSISRELQWVMDRRAAL